LDLLPLLSFDVTPTFELIFWVLQSNITETGEIAKGRVGWFFIITFLYIDFAGMDETKRIAHPAFHASDQKYYDPLLRRCCRYTDLLRLAVNSN